MSIEKRRMRAKGDEEIKRKNNKKSKPMIPVLHYSNIPLL